VSDVLTIGRYQLENLHRMGVRFTFFDLSEPASGESNQHELLAGSRLVAPGEVLNVLRAEKAPLDAAVILICEDGVKSKAVAEQLEQAGFMNVYRVEGGVAAL
jgi:rhodanese-related sulfurtransferase